VTWCFRETLLIALRFYQDVKRRLVRALLYLCDAHLVPECRLPLSPDPPIDRVLGDEVGDLAGCAGFVARDRVISAP
jgi:hypothetical protein